MWESDRVLVSWWLPPDNDVQNYRAGRKKRMLDVFGEWFGIEQACLSDLDKTCLPGALVHQDDILECNFEMDPAIPYEVLDSLRLKHGIDVSGLSSSLTHRGNLYRNHALLHGQV